MAKDPQEQLNEWLEELIDVQAAIDSANRRFEGLKMLIGGWIKMHPDLAPADEEIARIRERSLDGGPPRGAEAVRIILQEHMGERFYVSELVNLLRERDWLPESDNPANAVRAALERLVQADDSDVWKVPLNNGKVAYVYEPDFDRDRASRYDPSEEPF